MSLYTHMDSDHGRFKKVVRGWVRKELGKFIASGDLITSAGGKRGSTKVSIPLPSIELPRFVYGRPDEQGGEGAGVGQGKGQVGDTIPTSPAPGSEAAGDQPAEHVLEGELTLDELATMLGEELGLPHIEAKGKPHLTHQRSRYSGISPQGVESLKHFKRTYRAALKRSLATGTYDPRRPVIIPHKEDQHYRSASAVQEPACNAVMIYMMDVSGSMGDEQKELVRLTSFWLDTWLSKHYQGLERRYIIHDAAAQVVEEEEFYRTKESGGTLISSAYRQAHSLIEEHFPPQDWNVYLAHFSDGDNWSTQDSQECLDLMENTLLPMVNLFCYGQTQSRYGSGQFLGELEKRFAGHDKVALKHIKDRSGIIDALKAFLGRGR